MPRGGPSPTSRQRSVLAALVTLRHLPTAPVVPRTFPASPALLISAKRRRSSWAPSSNATRTRSGTLMPGPAREHSVPQPPPSYNPSEKNIDPTKFVPCPAVAPRTGPTWAVLGFDAGRGGPAARTTAMPTETRRLVRKSNSAPPERKSNSSAPVENFRISRPRPRYFIPKKKSCLRRSGTRVHRVPASV